MENEEIIQTTETPVEPVTPKKNRPKIGEVNCDQLKLREEPDTDADVLYIMAKGDVISILGEEKNFYKILCNGIVGYCVKKFITIK